MASLNKVFLMGNLTRDPEVRYLAGGVAVADLRMAVNERYRDKNNEWQEKATYLDVVVWRRQAETVGEYLSKGSPLLVEGRLQLDEWETKQGEKRSRLRVQGDRIQFLGRPSRAQYSDGPSEKDEPHEGSDDRNDAPEPPEEGRDDDENIPF